MIQGPWTWIKRTSELDKEARSIFLRLPAAHFVAEIEKGGKKKSASKHAWGASRRARQSDQSHLPSPSRPRRRHSINLVDFVKKGLRLGRIPE
jgi:hypothetical protein